MSTAPVAPPDSRKPIKLTKLATIFAVVLGIAFGLCSATFFVGSAHARLAIIVYYTMIGSVIVEAICVVGLLCVGLVAIVRSIDGKD